MNGAELSKDLVGGPQGFVGGHRRAAAQPVLRLQFLTEVIHLVAMMYVRFALSLRNAEDLLAERGIDIRLRPRGCLVDAVRINRGWRPKAWRRPHGASISGAGALTGCT